MEWYACMILSIGWMVISYSRDRSYTNASVFTAAMFVISAIRNSGQ